MNRFIPREKAGKKARKAQASEKRAAWAISPVTRKIDSKKIYSRKKLPRAGWDDGAGFFMPRLPAARKAPAA